MKIIDCVVGPYPRGFSDFTMPKVNVTFEDNSTKDLFTFYHDEISFRRDEFIGLTEQEAMMLRHKKDVAYLRS